MRTTRASTAILALAATLLLSTLSSARGRIPKDLPEKYREWLADIEILITDLELDAFLEIEKDYQRDAFIERFWQVRDQVEATRSNEFKDRYYARLAEARTEFKDRTDDRFGVFLLNGEPGWVKETDCGVLLWPIEVWNYGYSDHIRGSIKILFNQYATIPPNRRTIRIEGIFAGITG